MRKTFIGVGKTVEAAVEVAMESACLELNCSREEREWDIEIIDMPKKSFLGFKVNPAKASVSTEIPDEIPKAVKPHRQAEQKPKPQPKQKTEQAKKPRREAQKPEHDKNTRSEHEQVKAVSTEVSPGEITEKERLAKEYIESVTAAAGLNASCVVTRERGVTCIDIEGEGLGMIIGRRGETLDALQYLAGLAANRGEGDYMRLTVDCGGYRLKRRDTLEGLAKKLARQVLKTNVSKTLEPMNPFERRIIHATVSEMDGVNSWSIGEEPNRRVVISSPTAKPPARSGYRAAVDKNSDSYGRARRPRGFVREEGNSDIKTVSPECAPENEDAQVRADTRKSIREGRPPRDNNRRGQGRDAGSRRPPRRAAAPIPQGPPKATPESEKTAGISFGKIDLE